MRKKFYYRDTKYLNNAVYYEFRDDMQQYIKNVDRRDMLKDLLLKYQGDRLTHEEWEYLRECYPYNAQSKLLDAIYRLDTKILNYDSNYLMKLPPVVEKLILASFRVHVHDREGLVKGMSIEEVNKLIDVATDEVLNLYKTGKYKPLIDWDGIVIE